MLQDLGKGWIESLWENWKQYFQATQRNSEACLTLWNWVLYLVKSSCLSLAGTFTFITSLILGALYGSSSFLVMSFNLSAWFSSLKFQLFIFANRVFILWNLNFLLLSCLQSLAVFLKCNAFWQIKTERWGGKSSKKKRREFNQTYLCKLKGGRFYL